MRRTLIVLALASGCTIGGGPFVGVRLGDRRGHHRVVSGLEAGGGLAYVQGSIGLQGPSTGYGRLELAYNGVGFDLSDSPSHAPGYRLGIGYGGGGGRHGGVLVAGANYGLALVESKSCKQSTHALVGGVELRYVDGWQLVFAPRYELHGEACFH